MVLVVVLATLVGLLVAPLAAGAVVPGSTPGAAAGPPRAVLADGSWTLSYAVDLRVAGSLPGGLGALGRGAMTGTGAFEVKGGGVAGSYSGAGTALTAVTVPGGGSGPATLNLAMTGAVAGTAAKPMLQGTVHGSGTVSVDDGGFSRAVPVDFDGVLGDGAGAALDVRSARCGETGGVWSVALGPVSGASSAPPVSGTATFVAIRTDDASGAVPAYATQVGQLLSDVEAFAARFEDAPDEGAGGSPPVDVDVVSLDSDLDRAEAVSRSLPAVDACTADASYSSVVSVEIDRLLSAAAAQPARIDTVELLGLIGAGFRSGFVGEHRRGEGLARA